MATFLDVGLLQRFELIFPFLLVLFVVYGILTYTKLLGDNKTLHVLIAFVLALMSLISKNVGQIINAMAPGFIVMFIAGIFLLILIKGVGVEDVEIQKFINGPMWMVVLIIGIVIAVLAVIDVKVWQAEENGTLEDGIHSGDVDDGGKLGLIATLTNPNFMGLILIFLIGVFTVRWMSEPSVKI